MLAAVALLCAPLAWSQSGSTDSGAGTPNSAPQAGSSIWQTGTPDSSQTQNGTANPPQSGTVNPSPGGTQDPAQNGWPDASPQNGSSQSGAQDSSSQNGQNGSPDGSQNGAQDTSGQGGMTGDDTSQSGLGGPQATFSHPEKLPAMSLFSDTVSHTGATFTFSAGEVAQYISGGYLGTGNSGSSPAYWDNLNLLNAGINLVQAKPTFMWSLGYNGGISSTTGSVYSSYTNLNQAVNMHLIWAFAKRWQFRFKDSYFYSDDPFQPFFTFLTEPLPNNPNPVQYFPQTVVEQNQGTADISYLLGSHDSLDFYGAESFQHYLRGFVTPTTGYNPGSLWNSTTYSGGAFYQHLFSPRFSGGLGYIFTAMDFGHGQSRAGVQMFQIYGNYKISPRMTISGWVGPEVTATKDVVPLVCFPSGCLVEVQHATYVNVAEGATFSWAAPHGNSFGVQYSHSITNGGGLFGAVHYYQAVATYNRLLNRNWSFAAGALYMNSTSISNYAGQSYLHGLQGTVTFARKINQAWNLNAYYAIIHQDQNYYGDLGVPTSVLTSGVGVTVQYAWNHSLGR
jgi:hypothetical protein